MEWVDKISNNAVDMIDLSFQIGLKLSDYVFLPADIDISDYVVYDQIAIKKKKGFPFKYVLDFDDGECIQVGVLTEDRFTHTGGMGEQLDFCIGTYFYPHVELLVYQIAELEKILKNNQPGFTGFVCLDMLLYNREQFYYGLSFKPSKILHRMAVISDTGDKKTYTSAIRVFGDTSLLEQDKDINSFLHGKDEESFYLIATNDKFSLSWNTLYDLLFKYKKRIIFRTDGKNGLREGFIGIIDFLRGHRIIEEKRKEKKRRERGLEVVGTVSGQSREDKKNPYRSRD